MLKSISSSTWLSGEGNTGSTKRASNVPHSKKQNPKQSLGICHCEYQKGQAELDVGIGAKDRLLAHSQLSLNTHCSCRETDYFHSVNVRTQKIETTMLVLDAAYTEYKLFKPSPG